MSALGVPSSIRMSFRPPQRQAEPLAPVIPLLSRTDHAEPSVFRPDAMLRQARKQKDLFEGIVPEVCILDPDGDLVDYVRAVHSARRCRSWGCFHTDLWEWESEARRFGVVGRAVGASFAVLVAEQLFVSGCKLLVSIASAGEIATGLAKPSYMLIERALRDEGTSYHYLPAEMFVAADAGASQSGGGCRCRSRHSLEPGTSWTTDAPFRETATSIAERRAEGIHTVEMEAAALLAFANARAVPVICIAHITNTMGQAEGDFAKEEDCGAKTALLLVAEFARRRA
jgi:uridine phosphorylase